jgi:hypothetical protein
MVKPPPDPLDLVEARLNELEDRAELDPEGTLNEIRFLKALVADLERASRWNQGVTQELRWRLFEWEQAARKLAKV